MLQEALDVNYMCFICHRDMRRVEPLNGRWGEKRSFLRRAIDDKGCFDTIQSCVNVTLARCPVVIEAPWIALRHAIDTYI